MSHSSRSAQSAAFHSPVSVGSSGATPGTRTLTRSRRATLPYPAVPRLDSR